MSSLNNINISPKIIFSGNVHIIPAQFISLSSKEETQAVFFPKIQGQDKQCVRNHYGCRWRSERVASTECIFEN